jgi:hypothetical protein
VIDTGLLLSGVVIVAMLYAAASWVPAGSFERSDVLDRLVVPVLAGVFAGRAVAAGLDDPASLGSLRAFLVIRGGVEFWPGVAAAVAVLALGLRRSRSAHVAGDVALLVPFLLLAYAGYEATCVLRDGCYGPASPIGLVPDGLRSRQFPVGLVVALVVAALAWRLTTWSTGPGVKLLAAIGGVAAVRAVASVWLPRLGEGLTRQHVESIVIAVAGTAVALVVGLRARPHGLAGLPSAGAAVVATGVEGAEGAEDVEGADGAEVDGAVP